MSKPARLLAAAAAVVVLAALAGAGVLVARDRADAAGPLAGHRVSDADLRILVSAAASCPALTPARLAGQIMVASAFGDQPVATMTTGGATGPAALSPAVWQKWAPWPDATAADRAAAITALAHDMCQLAGQTRVAKVQGDPWQVTLAAYSGGVDAVLGAGGIPAAARDYVDTVRRYATWYAEQPEFALSPPVTGTSVGTAVLPVPDAYVKEVVSAGQVCGGLTPARVAAQLMATSAFDPGRLGSTGEQGIAQFRPQTWHAYASASQSPWEPADAVPALGKAMCALLGKSAGVYDKALAAYAGGKPVTALAVTIAQDEAQYAKDPRLKVAAPPSGAPKTPTSGASATPSGKASPGPTKSAAATVRAGQPPIKNAGGSSYGPYFIYNDATKECLDYAGNTGQAAGPVGQFTCAKDGTDNQEFAFVPRGADSAGNQKYWIKNTVDNRCVDLPREGSVDNWTELDESDCFDNDNQYFRLQLSFTSGDLQYYFLRNTVAGDMCVDVPGARTGGKSVTLDVGPCVAGDDMEWALVKKSEW